MTESYFEAHERATAQGESSYVDPDTGYRVFTRDALLVRNRCCGCGCRHCPFHHDNIPVSDRPDRIKQPAWLTERFESATIVLSWSGGKDSFLALRALRRQFYGQEIALLTTFDAITRVVAHQEIAINHVVEQAVSLNIGLVGVPLVSGADYLEQVSAGLALIPSLQYLAFGDLHLEPIRQWRENCFAPLVSKGLKLQFPIWHTPYDELLADFIASGARSEISAVTHPELTNLIGHNFGQSFIDDLPPDVDSFGENGEFHTRVFPVSR